MSNLRNQVILTHHSKPEELLKELDRQMGDSISDDNYDPAAFDNWKNIVMGISNNIKVK